MSAENGTEEQIPLRGIADDGDCEEDDDNDGYVSDSEHKNEDKPKTKCWLAMKITLRDIDVKEQTFEIEGSIDVFWQWHENDVPVALRDWKGDEKKKRLDKILFQNKLGQDIIRDKDLRDADVDGRVSSYLPINCHRMLSHIYTRMYMQMYVHILHD